MPGTKMHNSPWAELVVAPDTFRARAGRFLSVAGVLLLMGIVIEAGAMMAPRNATSVGLFPPHHRQVTQPFLAVPAAVTERALVE
jgi:hypothetical protein